MHGAALELLKMYLKPGMVALDVGSGTGYLTACMGLMVGNSGKVVGVEHIPELVELSIKAFRRDQPALLDSGVVNLHVGDGFLGYPDAGPYDAIHVGAAAPHVPKALISQLKPGGRLVIPVGREGGFQELMTVDKLQDGSTKKSSVMGVMYVPLTTRDHQLGLE